VFAENERYAGKILHLEAGHSLSLQYHERKDETLYVLKGEVRLTVEIEGESEMREIRLGEGQAFRIRPGVKHRMRADEPVDLVEVSSPELDDVVRLEDAYGRAGTTTPCLFAALGLGLGLSLAMAAGTAFGATGPTPTPTPRPRLSGGFGRTPAPSTGAASGDGQSMADVVKAAGAPKPDQKGVAITNDSLVKDTKKGRVSTAAPAKSGPTPRPAAAAAGSSAQPGPATAAAATPPPTAVGSPNTADEAMWKDRAHRAHQRVEDLKAQVAALDTESKRLENEFYRWDDGQYRDRVIKPQWDKAREDLETSKRQLTAAEAELADLPEQARKAGALPGWLRE
jgi:mannose-6-phosphate isomerase-like protein (cupin superfamily)